MSECVEMVVGGVGGGIVWKCVGVVKRDECENGVLCVVVCEICECVCGGKEVT